MPPGKSQRVERGNPPAPRPGVCLAQVGLTFNAVAFLVGLLSLVLHVAAIPIGLLAVAFGVRALRRADARPLPALQFGTVAATLGTLFTAYQALGFKDGGIGLFLWPALAAAVLGLLAVGLGLAAGWRRRAPSAPRPYRVFAGIFLLLLLATIGFSLESSRRHQRRERWAESFRQYHLPGKGCEVLVPSAVCAARTGDRRALENFLDWDPADVHKAGRDGRTPLHHAAARGDAPMARFLLDRGADARARDREGLTPADLATRHGHADLLPLLRR